MIRQAHTYLAGAVSGTALIAVAVVAFVVLVSVQALRDWPLAGLGGGGDDAAARPPAAAGGAGGREAQRRRGRGAGGRGRHRRRAAGVGGGGARRRLAAAPAPARPRPRRRRPAPRRAPAGGRRLAAGDQRRPSQLERRRRRSGGSAAARRRQHRLGGGGSSRLRNRDRRPSTTPSPASTRRPAARSAAAGVDRGHRRSRRRASPAPNRRSAKRSTKPSKASAKRSAACSAGGRLAGRTCLQPSQCPSHGGAWTGGAWPTRSRARRSTRAGSRVNERGQLEVAGCDVVELAAEFGTPAYVYAEDDMRARARAYREAFERAHRRLRGPLRQQGVPLHRRLPALRRGGPLGATSPRAASCTWRCAPASTPSASTCTATTRATRRSAAARRGRRRPPDPRLLRRDRALERLARRAPQRVLLRVTPGIKPSTHDYDRRPASSTRSSASGSSDGWRRGRSSACSPPTGSSCVGLHAHIGSQIFELESTTRWRSEVLGELAGDWCRVVNVGGGLGVAYTARGRAAADRRLRRRQGRMRRRGLRRGGADPARAGPLAGRQRRRHRSTRSAPSRRSPACAPTSPSTAACPTTCGRCSTAPLRSADRRPGRRLRHACRRSPACTASPATS